MPTLTDVSAPPSAIRAEKERQWGGLRDLLPKAPDLPPHHVRIEELYEALGTCSLALKGRVSLSNLRDICTVLNARLDERRTTAAASSPHEAVVARCRDLLNHWKESAASAPDVCETSAYQRDTILDLERVLGEHA